MSKRDVQAARDQLEKGDRVYINKRTYAGQPGRPIVDGGERARGIIKDLFANMAAVWHVRGDWVTTDKVEIFSLSKLQKITTAADRGDDLEEAPPPPRHLVKLVQQQERAALPPPKPANEVVKAEAMDDVSAWLEMGKSLRNSMQQKITGLASNAKLCRDSAAALIAEANKEAAAMRAEAEQMEREAVSLRKQLEAIDAATGGKS